MQVFLIFMHVLSLLYIYFNLVLSLADVRLEFFPIDPPRDFITRNQHHLRSHHLENYIATNSKQVLQHSLNKGKIVLLATPHLGHELSKETKLKYIYSNNL